MLRPLKKLNSLKNISQKNFFIKLIKLCLILLIFTVLGCKIGKPTLEPGTEAPNFDIIDLNNKNISLKDFRGKVLLLNFFSSWCESCQEELESLNNLSKDLSNTNFLVIGIAINDQSEELKKLVNEYQIKFPILFDKKNDLQSIYSIKGVPESYFVDGNGKILMFEDPSDGPLIKIVGSRQWNSKSIKEKILSLNGIKVS